jgi:hypothetical protein
VATDLCREAVLDKTDHIQHGNAAKSFASKVVCENLAAEFVMYIRPLVLSCVREINVVYEAAEIAVNELILFQSETNFRFFILLKFTSLGIGLSL